MIYSYPTAKQHVKTPGGKNLYFFQLKYINMHKSYKNTKVQGSTFNGSLISQIILKYFFISLGILILYFPMCKSQFLQYSFPELSLFCSEILLLAVSTRQKPEAIYTIR